MLQDVVLFFFCTKRVAVRVTGADVFPLAFSQLATSAPAGTQQGPKAVQRQGTEKSPAREHLLGLSEHLQAPWSSLLKLGSTSLLQTAAFRASSLCNTCRAVGTW